MRVVGNKYCFMENHIQLASGMTSNSYVRQFQVAQMNFNLVDQEEKLSGKRLRWRHLQAKLRRNK